ncbi:MAG TPA: MaoC family dehydratase [Phototrophicaceae bacterium]|nr:MaoC family dehydratase [Phototrophicaceae bacterium]
MEIKIGDTFSRTTVMTDERIRNYAEACGDTNSVHLDDEYAKTTRFGKRIAHGMLTASLISAILGNDYPGVGTIYLSQTAKFKAPVFIDDAITAAVEVTAYREDKRIVTLKTTCTNQDGVLVVEGEAVVIAP